MTDERLVRGIVVAFDDLADAHTPDYLEAAIESASSRPQRPAWTFPGRWLPMDIATQAAPAARMPWRQLGILALLAVLLTVATAIYIGSRTQLPDPYGPAGNGLVAYARGTDIVVADPGTGEERVIVSGPEADLAPRFSRDGTRIVFQRLAPAPEPGSHVMVVAPDGSGLTALTDEPLRLFASQMATPYTFAPDGRTVAIAAVDPDGRPGILLAQADGSAARWLDLPVTDMQLHTIREPAFRPPDGSQLLLTGERLGGGPIVFTVDVATGEVLDTVVDAAGLTGVDTARWSPDGQSISYAIWSNESFDLSMENHLIRPDGSGDRVLQAPTGTVWELGGAWSNDGTRMLVVRGSTSGWDQSRAAIVPTDGSGVGVDIPYPGPIQSGCCYAWEWSPDDSMILGKPITPSGVPGPQAIVDVDALTISEAPWNVSDDPAWQRVAP